MAGIHDLEEARLLLDAGVDLIGIPLRLPVNKEDLSERCAAHISRTLEGACCLITYLDNVREITALVNDMAVDFVQLHGTVDPGIMPELRRQLPGVSFIKSLIIGKQDQQSLLQTLQAFTPYVSAFITDSYDPQTGAEGATGRVHDWQASQRLVNESSLPVILAGGLHPGNVAEAIQSVQPWGVDVHTGVESGSGRKDPVLVQQFVASAKSAYGGIFKK